MIMVVLLLPYFAVKSRGPVNFNNQCISSRMMAVIELDKTCGPTLEAHTTSSAVTRPLSYVGAIGPPSKVRWFMNGCYCPL